jgi:hypothetical protein
LLGRISVRDKWSQGDEEEKIATIYGTYARWIRDVMASHA